MKRYLLLVLLCVSAFGQAPDASKFAPLPLMLVDATPGTEGIMLMIVTDGGQQHLEFVPVSKTKEVSARGGQFVRLGDVMTLLNANTEKINQLQAENERLWKVAMKDAPKPDTVVVQAPAPAGPSPEEIAAQEQAQQQAQAEQRRQQAIQALLLMNANRPQPYQLPMPVNPNAGRMQTNCTSYMVGNQMQTRCN